MQCAKKSVQNKPEEQRMGKDKNIPCGNNQVNKYKVISYVQINIYYYFLLVYKAIPLVVCG